MARERIPLGDEGINRSAERLDVLLGSRASALPPSAGGDMFSKIVLYFGDGSNAQFYDVNDTGLAASIAAVTGTDTIAIPPAADGTFTSAITIPANTAVQGTGTQTTFISAKITMSSNSFLRDVTVLITANSGANLTGIAGTGSGSAYMNTVSIQITQSGAGDAYGVEMGAGDLFARSCFISGTSTGGTGNGIKSGAGDIFIEEGSAVQGSGAAISGTNTFSIDSDKFIRLHDISGTYNWIFTADPTGLSAAIAAYGTGDLIQLPPGTITYTSQLSISKTVAIRGSASATSTIHSTGGVGSTIIATGAGVNLILDDLSVTAAAASALQVDNDANITAFRVLATGQADVASGVYCTGGGDLVAAQCNFTGKNGVYLDNANSIADITKSTLQTNSTVDTSSAIHIDGGAAIIEFTRIERTVGSNGLHVRKDAGTISLYACYYTHSLVSGTITYLQGDRGAYPEETWHARDIEAATLQRHTPLPGTLENIIYDDGTDWQAGTPRDAGMRASDLLTIWEPVTNGDQVDPGLVFMNGDIVITEVSD